MSAAVSLASARALAPRVARRRSVRKVRVSRRTDVFPDTRVPPTDESCGWRV